MNHQREIVYDRRNYALKGANTKGELFDVLDEWVDGLIEKYGNQAKNAEDWMWPELRMELTTNLGIDLLSDELTDYTANDVKSAIISRAKQYYERKENIYGAEQIRFLERFIMLRTIDEKWRDHLYAMDQLKEGINWRAYGQKDPLLEYKGEAFKAFVEMVSDMNQQTLRLCFRTQIGGPQPETRAIRRPASIRMTHQESDGMGFLPGMKPEAAERPQFMTNNGQPPKIRPIHVEAKVGRNDPCPCGSGKKYKHCHGAR
jgi:preprotein translocase subunit SecA